MRACAALALCLGVLTVPTPAMADQITIAPECYVTYDSGHVSFDPNGGLSFQSPSASAETGGCIVIYICCTHLLPERPPVEDWIAWGD